MLNYLKNDFPLESASEERYQLPESRLRDYTAAFEVDLDLEGEAEAPLGAKVASKVSELGGSKRCRCGSISHIRTSHAQCPLKKARKEAASKPESPATCDLDSSKGSSLSARHQTKHLQLIQAISRLEMLHSADLMGAWRSICLIAMQDRNYAKAAVRWQATVLGTLHEEFNCMDQTHCQDWVLNLKALLPRVSKPPLRAVLTK